MSSVSPSLLNYLPVITLKITSDTTYSISELLDFLATKYMVKKTSKNLHGDHNNFFAYAQIFPKEA